MNLDISQSATKLNIADMFFYLSKQKTELHSLVIIMFLGFGSQKPQEDIWWKEAKHLVLAVSLKSTRLRLLSQHQYKYLDPHLLGSSLKWEGTHSKPYVFTLASYYSHFIKLPIKALCPGWMESLDKNSL